MKILMLGSKEYPFPSSSYKYERKKPTGGMEAHVQKLSKYLARDDHEVFIVTRRFPGQAREEDLGNIHVYRTRFLYNMWLRTLTFNIFAFLKAFRIVRRERIDLIHSHGFVAGFFGSLLSRLNKTPLVWTPHGIVIDWPSPAKEAISFFHKVILRNAKKVIFISSEHVRKRVILNKKIPNVILTSGIDLVDFKKVPRGRKEICFLYLGRFARHKGVIHTIQAFSKLVKTFPNSVLYLVGEGKREGEILECIKENNLGKNVRFLGWVTDTPKVLSETDVFVLPSRETGEPVALLEAMAAGKIIITSLPYIEDGKNGLLIKQDVDDIYEKMLYVCKNFERCTKLGKNARESVKKKSWDKIIKDFETEYKGVLVK
ncbi:MAG: glycosyltransferase family 4 protein [Candidatus Aenigmatarchaeota archaeon]|nr:MAG: glycosyltransferase family 4 protein [Candidatus Aenigmarchaeota archaeon]